MLDAQEDLLIPDNRDFYKNVIAQTHIWPYLQKLKGKN